MRPKDSRLKQAPSKASRRTSLSRATKSLLINLDDLAEPLVTIPPDGGWGWVVVASSFIIMFCIDGIGYCFASFFQEISDEFNCKITDIAIVSSLIGGFYYLAGPLTCSAINKCGFQMIAFIGAMVAVTTFFAASLLNTFVPFMVLVGMCGGTAFNLIYTPSVIAIGFYFERWRALAMAIVCCGSSLGVMSFPLLMIKVFGNLHWRMKFRIISGVFVFCGFLGLTFKPIKNTKVERIVQFGGARQIASTTTFDAESEIKIQGGVPGFFQRFKNALFPTISEVSVGTGGSKTSTISYGYFIHRPEDEALSAYIRPEISDEVLGDRRSITTDGRQAERESMGCKECCRVYCECECTCCAFCSPCCKNANNTSFSNVNRPFYRDDIFYAGSVYAMPGHTSHASVPPAKGIPSLAYTLSVSRAPTQRDMEQQHQCVCCPEAFVRVLATMLDFQMLKSPTFLILLLSGYLSLMATYIVFTYLPSYAIEKGIDPEIATMLLSVIGVSNTVGRAVCGVVSCFPVLDINVISWITISISGAAIISIVFFYSLAEHIIICSIFGFHLASFAVLRAIVFVEFFGLENLTNCFGLNMVFQSLAAFSATPLANFIFHRTHNFSTVFLFTGSAILFSGLILIPTKCILRWERRRKKRVTFN